VSPFHKNLRLILITLYRDEETEMGAVGGNDDPIFTQINTECMEEFPSLGGKGGPTSVPNTSSHQGKVTATIRSGSRGFTISDENFPALGPEATVSLHVNSERPIISSVVNSKPPNLSIQVNHRPSGFTTRVSSSGGGNSNVFKEDFPALSGKLSGPMMNIASTQWSTNKKPDSKVTIVQHKQPDPPPPKQNKSQNFHMENDFPSLSSQFNSACALPKETTKAGKNLSSGDWAPASNSFVNAQSSDSDAVPVITPRNKKKKSKSKKTDTSGNAGTSTNESKKTTVKENASASTNDSKKTTAKEKHKEAKLTEQPEKVKKKGKELNDASNKVPSASVCSNNNVIHHENNNEYLDKGKSDLAVGKPERKKEEKKKQVKQAPDKATLSNLEEFPAMGRLKPRPPGFSDVARVPPPGFELPRREVTKPPPGLQAPSLPPGLEIAKPPPGFSLTNGLYPPLGNHYTYVSPADFPRRNSLLIGKIVKTIGQNRLDDFKEISVCFRSGEMSAKDYYEYCQDTMGHSAFYEIFPELLALLPDITKQQV
jgi:hypothetical protein